MSWVYRLLLLAMILVLLDREIVEAAPAPLPGRPGAMPANLIGEWRGNDVASVYVAAIGPRCRVAVDPSCDVTVAINTNGEVTTLTGRIWRSGRLELTGSHLDGQGTTVNVSVNNASWSKGNAGSITIKLSVNFPPDANGVGMGISYEVELMKRAGFISCIDAEQLLTSSEVQADSMECVSIGTQEEVAPLTSDAQLSDVSMTEPVIANSSNVSVTTYVVPESSTDGLPYYEGDPFEEAVVLLTSDAQLSYSSMTQPAIANFPNVSLTADDVSEPSTDDLAYYEGDQIEEVNATIDCRAGDLAVETSLDVLIGCLIDENFGARTAANDRLLQLFDAAVQDVAASSDEAPSGFEFLQHPTVQAFLDTSRKMLAAGPDLELVQRLQSLVTSSRITPYFIEAALSSDDAATISSAIYNGFVVPWMTSSSNQNALMTLLTEGESLASQIEANYLTRVSPKVDDIIKSFGRPFLLRLQWDILYSGFDGGTETIELPYEGLLTHTPTGRSYYIKLFTQEGDASSEVVLVHRSTWTLPLSSLISDRTMVLLVLFNRLPLKALSKVTEVTVGMCAAKNYASVMPETYWSSFTRVSNELPIIIGVCNEIFPSEGQFMVLGIDQLERGIFSAVFPDARLGAVPVRHPSFHELLEALLRPTSTVSAG